MNEYSSLNDATKISSINMSRLDIKQYDKYHENNKPK